ncbi:MAG: PQQ-binding-like beta-propeller repeat protein, partial [Candidatus Cloacimonetes bacterium]|nr:PQQ-binding-like beta-propeller repeat protein [Candidatus Cloacimonadota bacterium]
MKNKNKSLGIYMLIIVMALIAYFPRPAVAQLADTPWPMFHHDLNHTGLSPYTGPDTATLKWNYETGGTIKSSPAIGADGTIYVGSADYKLYAINDDGTLKWSYITGGEVYSSPAIGADSTIYVGSRDYKLHAINDDGTLKWSYETGDIIYSAPAIGADGTIYVGSYDDKLYAINDDGTLKWSYLTGDNVYSSPTIGADSTIYVGSRDYKLYAINDDGTLKWSYLTGDWILSSPAIGADSTIYIGSADYKLYAINDDGTLKWSYPTGEKVYSSPAIGADSTIYVGSYDYKLYAINVDGTLKWSYLVGDNTRSSPAIGADGTIYIGSNDDKLYAINDDGTLKWSYLTVGNVYSSPAIGADGTIYVGSYDNNLYAFGTAVIIGDFNSDGYVDATDLQMFGDHWHFVNTDPGWDPLYDLVPDNIIDAADLQVFGDHWHEGTPPTRSGQEGRGPNENAGIVFDLDATTTGNQNLTGIPSQPTGTYIRVDVYCTDVVNLDTYEFEVIYNPTELEYVSSSATNPITYEGNILESNGGTALGWMVDSSTPGVLSIAYTLAGNDPLEAPEGEGLIADIVFLSLVDTYGTLSFGDVYFYDSYGVVDLITNKGAASIGGGEVVTLPIPTGDPVYFDFDGGGGSGGSTVTIDPPAGGGSITITQYDTPPESLPFPGNALNLWFDIDATSYTGGFPVDVTFTWDTPVPVGSSAPILAVSTDGGTSW